MKPKARMFFFQWAAWVFGIFKSKKKKKKRHGIEKYITYFFSSSKLLFYKLFSVWHVAGKFIGGKLFVAKFKIHSLLVRIS